MPMYDTIATVLMSVWGLDEETAREAANLRINTEAITLPCTEVYIKEIELEMNERIYEAQHAAPAGSDSA